MITVDLRQYIIKCSYHAIHAALGIQEKLALLGYQNVEYDGEAVRSGVFFLSAQSGHFYKVTLGPNGIIGLKRGRVNVSFD